MKFNKKALLFLLLAICSIFETVVYYKGGSIAMGRIFIGLAAFNVIMFFYMLKGGTREK